MRSSFGLKPEEVDDWIGEMLEETRPHRDAIKREFAAEMRAARERQTETGSETEVRTG